MADTPVIIFNEGSAQQTLPGRSLNKVSSNSYDASPVLKESLWSIMESYIQYYASGASHTARAKRHDLEHFLGFLARNGKALNDIPVSDWTPEASNQFIEDRLSSGDAPSTVARRLATIKHFGRTLADRVPGFVNPAREAKAPVFEVVRPQGLESEDINLLRESAKILQLENPEAFTHFRNRVLLEMLLGTGLRADEVRLLKRAQVSDDISWLKHVKTKGKRFRDVYLHTELASLLSDYLAGSRDYIIKNHSGAATWQENIWARIPVFISIKNSDPARPESFALAPKTLWRIISELGNRARLISSVSAPEMPHLHPHKLRHTFAHGLLDTSNDIRLVAQALGHSDVRTTMRYTERYKEELAIAMERRASAERRK